MPRNYVLVLKSHGRMTVLKHFFNKHEVLKEFTSNVEEQEVRVQNYVIYFFKRENYSIKHTEKKSVNTYLYINLS